MGSRFRIATLLSAVLAISSCGDEATTPEAPVDDYVTSDSIIVAISTEQPTFVVGSEFTATVSAENTTEEPIVFGRGSSSCRLAAVIRIGNEDHVMLDARYCTADEVAWRLSPGELAQEVFKWNGLAQFDDERKLVPLGSYEVRGLAGQYIGEPITIEVEE